MRPSPRKRRNRPLITRYKISFLGFKTFMVWRITVWSITYPSFSCSWQQESWYPASWRIEWSNQFNAKIYLFADLNGTSSIEFGTFAERVCSEFGLERQWWKKMLNFNFLCLSNTDYSVMSPLLVMEHSSFLWQWKISERYYQKDIYREQFLRAKNHVLWQIPSYYYL